MKKILKRIQYAFDKELSKGMGRVLLLLILIVIFANVILGTISYYWAEDKALIKYIWDSFTHMLDPGVISATSYDDYGFLIPMLFATLFGVLFTATLIGIINNIISDKVDSLRKSESQILDKNHTIILGYNERTFNIIGQLIMAYSTRNKKHLIVVIGDRDKNEMEEEIRKYIKDEFMTGITGNNLKERLAKKRINKRVIKRTPILCRRGIPGDRGVLERCNIKNCRSIIINEFNDFSTMKTLLTINNISKADRNVDLDPYVVAVSMKKENVKLFNYVSEDEWKKYIFFFSDQISKITAHSCIHPGVAAAFEDLFSYNGDEIYIEKPRDFEKIFEDRDEVEFRYMLNKIRRGIAIGYKRDGKIYLNPPIKTPICVTDELVLVEECLGACYAGDDRYNRSKKFNFTNKEKIDKSDNILVLGANENLPQILAELNKYMKTYSKVIVSCTLEQLKNSLRNLNLEKYSYELEISLRQLMSISEQYYMDNRVEELFKKIIESYIVIQNNETSEESNEESICYADISLRICDIYNTDSAEILFANIEDFLEKEEKIEHILLLSDTTTSGNMADEATLFLLVNLRNMLKNKEWNVNITTEMRKSSNQQIANNTDVDDFIISDNIISNMLTQVSQYSGLFNIFNDILDVDGNEIYLEKFTDYFDFENYIEINMFQLTQLISTNYRKIPIGYRIKNDNNYDIVINPIKNKNYKFRKDDSIILLALED